LDASQSSSRSNRPIVHGGKQAAAAGLATTALEAKIQATDTGAHFSSSTSSASPCSAVEELGAGVADGEFDRRRKALLLRIVPQAYL
jgi:hypothetical protein